MRKWLIAGAVLLILIVVGVVGLLNINALIARNKDYLIGQAEAALGRKVSVDKVEATLFSGIGARLTDFTMIHLRGRWICPEHTRLYAQASTD